MNYNKILRNTVFKHRNKSLYETEAYHGSPFDFDKFDVSFMGKGEGAQVHGWGLYFSLDNSTAKGYQERLSKNFPLFMKFHGKKYKKGSIAYTILKYILNSDNDKAKEYLTSLYYNDEFTSKYPKYEKVYGKLIDKIDEIDYNDIDPVYGQSYTVELPSLEYFLDEQKSMDKQSDYIKNCLHKLYSENQKLYINFLKNGVYDGLSLYKKLKEGLGSKRKASELLNKYGIVGIKYNGRRDGNCVVIFSDKDIKILKKRNIAQKSIETNKKDDLLKCINEFVRINGFEKNYKVSDNYDTVVLTMDISNFKYGYVDGYTRDGLSFETFEKLLTGNGYDLFMNDYYEQDLGQINYYSHKVFDDILKQNNIPLTLKNIVEDVELHETDSIYYEFLYDNFSDNDNIFNCISIAQELGAEREAISECWKQFKEYYPFIQEQTWNGESIQCIISSDDIIDSIIHSDTDNFFEYYCEKYHQGTDDLLLISEPRYGWSGFDENHWYYCLKYAAPKAIEIYRHHNQDNSNQ